LQSFSGKDGTVPKDMLMVPEPPVRVLRLQGPSYTHEEVQLNNALLRLDPVNIGVHECRIVFHDGVPIDAPIMISARIGDTQVAICVELGMIQAMLDALGYRQDVSVISSETKALVIEHITEPYMQFFETLFEGRFIIERVEPIESLPQEPCLLLGLSGIVQDVLPILLIDPDAYFGRILEALPQPQADLSQADLDLELQMSARAEPIEVDAEVLSQLEVGAGFMMPEGWRPEVTHVVIGNAREAALRFEDGGYYIAGPIHDIDRKGTTMSEYDDIEVEISLEILRGKMTLADLADVSEGMILSFGQGTPNTVSLVHDQRTIAKGEIVEVGEEFGIRITSVE